MFWYKSPSGILLLGETKKVVKKYCRGKVLDVGAGRLAYKSLLEKHCEEYKSIDFKKTNPELDYVGDAQNMNVIVDESFETVFCSQMLEYVPEPQKVFSEMERILKPGGHAIISVPFLGYLHNEPNDFFRYTKHSLRFMSEKVGLEMVEIKEVGGFFSYIGYVWSTLFLVFFAGFSGSALIALIVNIPVSHMFIFLDKLTGNKKIIPPNYLLVLEKNG